MIKLSLTDFVDISSKNGMSKIRNVKKVKNRPDYSPATDYYKQLREHIVNLHRGNHSKNSFLPVDRLTKNEKKHLHYAIIITGYKKFWGKKKIEWFEPPHNYWIDGDISVTINPELGLIIDDKPHVIKLYFKNEKLSKPKSEMSLFLLHHFLPKEYNTQNITYSILDIRNSKLIKANGFNEMILAAIKGEAQYIQSVWSSI